MYLYNSALIVTPFIQCNTIPIDEENTALFNIQLTEHRRRRYLQSVVIQYVQSPREAPNALSLYNILDGLLKVINSMGGLLPPSSGEVRFGRIRNRRHLQHWQGFDDLVYIGEVDEVADNGESGANGPNTDDRADNGSDDADSHSVVATDGDSDGERITELSDDEDGPVIIGDSRYDRVGDSAENPIILV